MRKLVSCLALVVCLVLADSTVKAVSYNTINLSTGINANVPGNPVLGAGQPDTHWKVTGTPTGTSLGSAKVINTAIYPFTAYTTLSGTAYINSGQSKSGNYEYERCFCLENKKNAAMELQLRADNQAKVFLNSYSNQLLDVTWNDSFRNRPGLLKTAKGFRKGQNCIRIRVKNQSSVTGLNSKILVKGYGARGSQNGCCGKPVNPFRKKAAHKDGNKKKRRAQGTLITSPKGKMR